MVAKNRATAPLNADNLGIDATVVSEDVGRTSYLRISKTWLYPFVFILALLIIYRILSTEWYFKGLDSLYVDVGFAYIMLLSVSVLVRFPLALSYKPQKFKFGTVPQYQVRWPEFKGDDAIVIEKETEVRPTVTVIIPSFNEEEAIGATITKIFENDYPIEKLDVIAINDGSKDGTLKVLQELATRYPKLHVVNFEENKGKRYGLYYGFKHATGEIVGVVDSDTQLFPDCITELVKVLCDPLHPNIAGVSAHTDVRNKSKAIEKMQDANYFPQFLLYKSAESVLYAVTCLPGCASAYRKEVVLTFIDEWVNQEFLGKKCVVGEDRGLTTFLLKAGKDSVYTPAARAETNVPTTVKRLIKQRMRWKRSFLREIILQSKFMYKRKAAFVFYPYMITSLLSPFVTIFLIFILPFFLGPQILIIYCSGIALVTMVYAAYSKMYRKDYSIFWLGAWAIFNMAIMSWISIYAWCTVTEGAWMTR